MAKPNTRSFLDRCIRDEQGNLALFQVPNLPLITWGVATVLNKLLDGRISHFFEFLAFGALFTWAWLELFQGSNYTRRLLGLVMLVFLLLNRV